VLIRLVAAIPFVAGSTVRAYLDAAVAVTREVLR